MAGKKVILVMGAGDATGGAIARRFAREGYVACVARRNEDQLGDLCRDIEAAGGEAHPFGVDGRKEDQVEKLVDDIERDIGPIDVGVFNVGGNIHFNILEMTAKKFYKVWEMGCFAGFLFGREIARRMVPREEGTILFTGATASVRGGAGFSGFAGAKFGLRALAQSMARELGQKGIHVGHVVIDGPIDTQFVHEQFPELVKERPRDGILNPDDIAENYYMLHMQPRSAWTHEIDLRPWVEPW